MKKTILLFCIIFSACATTTNYGAADDILAFAKGLRDNNLNLIESHIDKNALKQQAMTIARDIAIKEASKKMGNGFGAQVAAITAVDILKPVIEAAANEALKPENLSFFARRAGLNNNLEMPSRFKASLALTKIEENKVCVKDPSTKNCILYFGNYGNVWKLNGFDEKALRERIKIGNLK